MDLDLAFFLPRPPLDFERLRLEKSPFFLPVFVSRSGELQARHSHVNKKIQSASLKTGSTAIARSQREKSS